MNGIKYFLLLLIALIANVSYSQIKDEETFEQVLHDIQTRNFDRPIQLISNELSSMENLPISEFEDSAYIGLTSLLATAYVQTNQVADAEKLLTHAINFFDGVTRKSPLIYQLYYAYGAFSASIENYETAKNYLEVTVDYLKDFGIQNEDYGIILSVLAACHMKTNQLDLAYDEIMESIAIIKRSSSRFTSANLIQVYEKAGAICNELGKHEASKEYIKMAYDACVGIGEYTSEFINVGTDLATIYLNEESFNDALSIFHQVEKLELNDIERNKVYNGIMTANYFLGNERDCIDYACKSSNLLKEQSIRFISSLTLKEQEEKWQSNSMQLKFNFGVLDKYPENKLALRMAYDNILFIKRLSYEYHIYLRSVSRNDPSIHNTLTQIKKSRAALFASKLSDDFITLKNNLTEAEWLLLNQIQAKGQSFNASQIPTWKDVRDNLQFGEYAVEFVSYIGPCRLEEEKELRYAALLLSSQCEAPLFIDLCSHKELYNLYFNVLVNQEVGLNNLYKKDKNNTVLYEFLWKNIEPIVGNAKTIYCSPIISVQDINLGFIVCPDGKYLNEKHDIRLLTSTGLLCDRVHDKDIKSAVVFGDITFSSEKTDRESRYRDIILNELYDATRSGFGHLPASKIEVDTITDNLVNNGIKVNLFKGRDATEASFCNLDENSPSIIHIASHAFYLVGFDKYIDYFSKLTPYSFKDLSMLLSGLLFSSANNVFLNESNDIDLYDGVLTSEELSLLDLSNTELAVVSACNSSLGQASQEGYGGLVKAFKMAGVKHLLVSLWAVSDEATALLMRHFYKYLVNGVEMNKALLKAQYDTAELYPDPYYWASFIILD